LNVLNEKRTKERKSGDGACKCVNVAMYVSGADIEKKRTAKKKKFKNRRIRRN